MAIENTSQLKAAIAMLQVDIEVRKKILTEQYNATTEAWKPGNILKSTLNNIVNTEELPDKLIATALGLGAGVLTKKMLIGKSTNVFKRIFGTVIEMAVGGIVAKHAPAIKEKGVELFNKITNNSDERY